MLRSVLDQSSQLLRGNDIRKHWRRLLYDDSLCEQEKSFPGAWVITKARSKLVISERSRVVGASCCIFMVLIYKKSRTEDGKRLIKSVKENIWNKYKYVKQVLFHNMGVKTFENLYYLTKSHPELYLYLEMYCFGLSFIFWKGFHSTLYSLIHSNHVSRYHGAELNKLDEHKNSILRLFGLTGTTFLYWVLLVPYLRDQLTNGMLCLNQWICSYSLDAIKLEENYWKSSVYNLLLDECNGTQALANEILEYVGDSQVHQLFQDKIETSSIWDYGDNDNDIEDHNHNNNNNVIVLNRNRINRVSRQHSTKLKAMIRKWDLIRTTVFVGLTMYSTFEFILLANKIIKCELKDQERYYKEIETFHEKSDLKLYGKPFSERVKEDGFWRQMFYNKVYKKIVRNDTIRNFIDSALYNLIYYPIATVYTNIKYYGAMGITKLESYRVPSFFIRVIRKVFGIITYIPRKMKNHRERMLTDEDYKMQTRHRAWTLLSTGFWTLISLVVYRIMTEDVRRL